MLQIVRYRTFPNIFPIGFFLSKPQEGAKAPPREGQGVLLGQNPPPVSAPVVNVKEFCKNVRLTSSSAENILARYDRKTDYFFYFFYLKSIRIEPLLLFYFLFAHLSQFYN